MIRKIGFLLAITTSLVTYQASAAGWSGEATIEGIYAVNDTTVIITLSSFTNPDNCQVNENGHVILNPATNKTWFSLLLAAYAAKKTVNIFVASTCTTVWENTSYADVAHVRLL
ncbi:hypothetical protein FKG94_16730 [Exilibacterium tricleocarpae]|uniref:Uncharacterized protein n=1 Tax=Exilibacterium tricleocarpae TaxID=2591008 RepID=A0A545TAL5_9GAMM|nr:hypothetical protein [Exilibacterium tricleocarpae]TQV74248.1 hypothetical protein FKG94_16730 [Exilibacterium tricleocarpae]